METGELIGVAGEVGSGKSSLVAAIMGEVNDSISTVKAGYLIIYLGTLLGFLLEPPVQKTMKGQKIHT